MFKVLCQFRFSHLVFFTQSSTASKLNFSRHLIEFKANADPYPNPNANPNANPDPNLKLNGVRNPNCNPDINRNPNPNDDPNPN